MVDPSVPPGFRTDEPPHDPKQQLLVWGIDLHALGWQQEDPRPRWMVVQWYRLGGMDPGGWYWATPGRRTTIRILGWQPLDRLDALGEIMAAETEGVQHRDDERRPHAP